MTSPMLAPTLNPCLNGGCHFTWLVNCGLVEVIVQLTEDIMECGAHQSQFTYSSVSFTLISAPSPSMLQSEPPHQKHYGQFVCTSGWGFETASRLLSLQRFSSSHIMEPFYNRFSIY
uniref:Uncharacterized protein n=1 Tax=Anguilla anguilla TaxID=7936 RepID=A0A0E9WR24_ANGAN